MAFSPDFRDFQIPRSALEIRTSRSSGPGGQNVNKVESKVEIRFHLESAYWIPPEVKQRLLKNYAARISKEGEFVLSSSESRSQHQNLELCLEKLREFIGRCWRAPKKRIATKATRASRERRIESKKIRSNTKKDRSKKWD